jgi:hypothetical protein
MKEIESLILRVAEPPGNKVKGKFIRSENLLGKVKAEYRRRRTAEEEDLFGAPRWRRKPAGRPRPRPHPTEGRRPVLAEHAEQVRLLIARCKKKLLKARVRRDGRINFGGKLYTSPSLAAAAACGRSTCNGWVFWKYERAPGDWVLLNELRK